MMSGIQASLGATAICLLLALPCHAEDVAAEAVKIDVAQCQEDIEQVFRQNVDCEVSLRLGGGGRDHLPPELRGLIEDVDCTIPVKVAKRDIYGLWILPDRFAPPPIEAICTISLANGSSTRVTPKVAVACARAGSKWQCDQALDGLNSLGVLGTIIGNFFARDDSLSEALAAAIIGLE